MTNKTSNTCHFGTLADKLPKKHQQKTQYMTQQKKT